MKKLLYITTAIIFFLSLKQHADAQGCVAIRSTGAACTMHQPEQQHMSKSGSWGLNVNTRYFKSFRHFAGDEEQKQRVDSGTEVINHSYSVDLTLTHNINERWSIALDAPIVSNARSSLYEHGGKERHSSHSFGLGDVRIAAYAWLLDPMKAKKGNIQAGLGIKLPTGDYKYMDYFYNDTSKVLGPVDQSIQLGDGGTGFTTEVNGYYKFSKAISVYGNFYYLFNPREQNGVSNARGGVSSSTSISYGSNVMSVPDQYMIRAGANFEIDKFVISAGVRDERLPAKDLIGGSEGFRRPGYIISAEPGISYMNKRFTAYAYVPVAIERNRIQSVPDMHRTEITGIKYIGDAAFSDYTINAGISFRL